MFGFSSLCVYYSNLQINIQGKIYEISLKKDFRDVLFHFLDMFLIQGGFHM